MLELHNISKTYKSGDNTIKILDDTSFVFNANSSTALIGPSGIGKSTILHIAALLDNIDSGKIIINGTGCDFNNDEQLANIRRYNIGFVYQFHYLIEELTVLENIIMPQRLIDIPIEQARENALKLLDKFELLHRQEYYPHQLSGGQNQRAAIIRAIINKPKILLADEPTGSLDQKIAHSVVTEILEITKEYNLCTIVATHNMSIAKLMDHSITIDNGKIQSV